MHGLRTPHSSVIFESRFELSEYLRTTYDKFELLVRRGFYYTNDDLWVGIENGQAKVGVSDYLQRTSGDIAFIEVAKAGSTVEKGKELGTVESAKATIDVLPHLRKS